MMMNSHRFQSNFSPERVGKEREEGDWLRRGIYFGRTERGRSEREDKAQGRGGKTSQSLDLKRTQKWIWKSSEGA